MSKNDVKDIKEKGDVYHRRCHEALVKIDKLLRQELHRCSIIESHLKHLKTINSQDG